MEGLNLVSGMEVGFGGVWIGAAPYLLFIPDKDGDDKPDGRAAGAARRLGLPGHARDAQHLHLGAGRLALRLPRRLHPLARRQAGHAGRPAREDQRRHLALPPDAARLRGVRRTAPATRGAWTSTTSARRSSRRASSRTAGTSSRAAATSGRRASTSTRTPTTTSRPSPTTATTSARTRTAATTAVRHRRRRPRPLRADDLPRRRLAGGVPRPDVHGQHPRPAAQRGHARWRRAPATSAEARPGLPAGQRRLGAVHQLPLRPGRQRLPIDWYDKQACHHHDPKIWDRTNGRIYKVSYQGTKPVDGVDLAEGDGRGAGEVPAARERLVRPPRPPAACRSAAAGEPKPSADGAALAKIAFDHADETRRLRGLWALHATGGLTPRTHRSRGWTTTAHVRAWTIQLALEDKQARRRPARGSWRDRPQRRPSPVVRLYLASRCSAAAGRPLGHPRRPARHTPRTRPTTTCR